ncbi:hypothetical protein ACR6C2_16850 [Streptomyces sp. INA 01156]
MNLAVKQGQAATNPKAPELTKEYGGVWEMPLYLVNVQANGGALSTTNVGPYDMAESVAVPWNIAHACPLQQNGTFVYDMDNNGTGGQTEYFRGRDGFVMSRHLGQSQSYRPNTLNAKSSLAADNRTGRWRYIAPGIVYFSLPSRHTRIRAFRSPDLTGTSARLFPSLPVDIRGRYSAGTSRIPPDIRASRTTSTLRCKLRRGPRT